MKIFLYGTILSREFKLLNFRENGINKGIVDEVHREDFDLTNLISDILRERGIIEFIDLAILSVKVVKCEDSFNSEINLEATYRARIDKCELKEGYIFQEIIHLNKLTEQFNEIYVLRMEKEPYVIENNEFLLKSLSDPYYTIEGREEIIKHMKINDSMFGNDSYFPGS